jgi:hypothetical protein
LTLSHHQFLSIRQRFLPILLLATLLGCSKSDSNPIMDFGEGEGITYRTSNNMTGGPADLTDWTSDGEWNKQERALFADLGLDLNGPQQGATSCHTGLFPNPASSAVNWTMQTYAPTSGAGGYTVSATLVDRNYHIRQRIDRQSVINGITYILDLTRIGLSPNELYRLYYVVSNTNGLVYKGHGDIRCTPQ